jgi:glutathione peroxidase
MLKLVTSLMLFCLMSCAGSTPKLTPTGTGPLNVPLKLIDGKETTLSKLGEGKKAFLIVNTASKCGYTSQYEGLEKLHKKYFPKGLVVVGFPSNDFMGQEPGKNEEIATFCRTQYGVSFPMFVKNSVRGKDIQPLYAELLQLGTKPGRAAKGQEGQLEDVSWNFEKFLISTDGTLLGRFKSSVAPDDKALVEAIESALR